jgi:hypothetical protein
MIDRALPCVLRSTQETGRRFGGLGVLPPGAAAASRWRPAAGRQGDGAGVACAGGVAREAVIRRNDT